MSETEGPTSWIPNTGTVRKMIFFYWLKTKICFWAQIRTRLLGTNGASVSTQKWTPLFWMPAALPALLTSTITCKTTLRFAEWIQNNTVNTTHWRGSNMASWKNSPSVVLTRKLTAPAIGINSRRYERYNEFDVSSDQTMQSTALKI